MQHVGGWKTLNERCGVSSENQENAGQNEIDRRQGWKRKIDDRRERLGSGGKKPLRPQSERRR